MAELLDDDDFRLSMQVSPRARDPRDNEGLRTLVVHRLTKTPKAVARMALRQDKVSMYCEIDNQWFPIKNLEFPIGWTCPRCGREFEIEFAVYEAVGDDEDED